MSVRRALFFAAILAAGCGTQTVIASAGQFKSPGGIAATSAGDRDILFIANSGDDGLRALQLCLNPSDGGPGPTTCPATQDLQFIPGPVRVFPAQIESGQRPVHVAGPRLLRADGSKVGAALVAATDRNLHVVDARSLIDAQNGTGPAKPALSLPLDAPPIDVVAVNPLDGNQLETAAPSVKAFVVEQGTGAAPPQLLALDVTLDASGSAQLPAIVGRCALSGVVPQRLAAIPGNDASVYVADAAGDGVLRVDRADISSTANPPPNCVTHRISAGGRPVHSMALTPPWYDSAGEHPAGDLLMMILEPSAAASAGTDLDPGGVLFVNTQTGAIVPIPPFGLFEAGREAMQPITPPGAGFLREGAFLRAQRSVGTCTPPSPCTPLFVGTPTSAPVHSYFLLAAVSNTDGSTYFVDVLSRRFVNPSEFSQLPGAFDPTVDNPNPALSPASLDPNAAVLTFTPPVPGHPLPGWFTSGVTHSAQWRVIWHSPIPGLDRRAGSVTSPGDGTLVFTPATPDLNHWISDPVLRLRAGDVVAFRSYTVTNPSPGCQAVANENATPARFELPILAVAADHLTLAPLPDTPAQAGFHPNCPSFAIVAEVRTAADKPWIVFDGNIVKQRIATGERFVGTERRFDYPKDYTTDLLPGAADNVAVSFTITGNEPAASVSGFTFAMTVNDVLAPTYRDPGAASGFANDVYAYSSTRYPTLVFTSVTGADSVVQADPAVLQPPAIGELVYR